VDNDPNSSGGRVLMTRRNALRLFGGGAAATFLDAMCIEPDAVRVTRENVTCRRLPPALDGLRVALLADFHFRPGLDDALLAETVDFVGREKPDLVALAGDYMNHDPRVLEPLLEGLRKLSAAHGVFAVLGNHDGWTGERETIRRQFEKAGISFLINRHSVVSIHGQSLAVAGTDFVWLGKPDPARTLKGLSAGTPVLALVHEPDYFDVMASDRPIMLQLSGHSHGGQCRMPFVGITPYLPKYGRNYVYGRYHLGDSNLFVTRGVGTTSLRVRFACPPEVAILTLRNNGMA
jgi:predicted MPP superfamily phosphohydrolase